MDNSLNTLTACRHLSLSTNCIEKMINLPNLSRIFASTPLFYSWQWGTNIASRNYFLPTLYTLSFQKNLRWSLKTSVTLSTLWMVCTENLQILSLARNQIKRISGLEEIGQTLRELWLSYNQIERLDGLQPCVKLEVLYMSNNRVKGWEEVEKLVSWLALRFIGKRVATVTVIQCQKKTYRHTFVAFLARGRTGGHTQATSDRLSLGEHSQNQEIHLP
uniref:Dynein axonemal light chain 1 n=1 Tax=Neospora caninum (strain Liverpool) TaxID=572307 RepID=A0A0F7UAI2_NEOCL|nr:TPA: hypothetical protein BN1204_014880 [Neospora caninum Liverpool]